MNILFKLLATLFPTPKHIHQRINSDLKPCFYCGQWFKSSCKKYANDIPHNCPHECECNILRPKCLQCREERKQYHELFKYR